MPEACGLSDLSEYISKNSYICSFQAQFMLLVFEYLS